jgi:hypothetical protein
VKALVENTAQQEPQRGRRGRWKPGQSGNPGGRPRVQAIVREAAQFDSLEAYQKIRELMRAAESDAVQLAAAIKVLQLAGVQFTVSIQQPEPEPPPPAAQALPDKALDDGLVN